MYRCWQQRGTRAFLNFIQINGSFANVHVSCLGVISRAWAENFPEGKKQKGMSGFRAASFSQSQSLNEMLPSFSFSCRVSCASFSSSSWTFPVKIILFGLFSQIKRRNWKKKPPTNSSFICAITHKRKLYAPLLFPILHYFSFLSWHQPTGVKMLKSDHRGGKLRHIRFETVKA